MATVELAIYDLTGGMARQMAAPLAGLLDGKSVDMVPHTGVRVFGQEIVYAGGVLSQSIAQVEAGMDRKPNKIERLGTTTKTEAEIQAFLRSVSGQWTASNYDLWTHNCNNFSECVVNFLCGTSIPKWILDFPTEILQTPLGQMLAPMLGTQQDALNGQLGTRGYVAPVAPPAVAPADAMSVTIKPATGNAAQRTLSLAKTATVGDLRVALSVDATPRFVFMGKLLTDDAKTLQSYGVADGLTVLQVAGRGSPAASPTAAPPTPPVMPSTAQDSAIARAEAAGGAGVLRTLHKILSNVAHHPAEAKYRTLKTANAAFRRKCLDHDGARDVLLCAGFVAGEGVLTVTPSATAYPVLTRVERALSARLDALEASASPAQAPDLGALMAGMGGAGMGGGGMPDPAMMQQMMQGMGGPGSPGGMSEMMAGLQQNPALIAQVQRMMADPAAMERAMATVRSNPQMAQMLAQRMGMGGGAGGAGGMGGMPDPAMMQQMMRDPAMMQMAQQMMGGGGAPPLGAPPLGGGGALAAALAGLNPGGAAAPPAASAAAARCQCGNFATPGHANCNACRRRPP